MTKPNMLLTWEEIAGREDLGATTKKTQYHQWLCLFQWRTNIREQGLDDGHHEQLVNITQQFPNHWQLHAEKAVLAKLFYQLISNSRWAASSTQNKGAETAGVTGSGSSCPAWIAEDHDSWRSWFSMNQLKISWQDEATAWNGKCCTWMALSAFRIWPMGQGLAPADLRQLRISLPQTIEGF